MDLSPAGAADDILYVAPAAGGLFHNLVIQGLKAFCVELFDVFQCLFLSVS